MNKKYDCILETNHKKRIVIDKDVHPFNFTLSLSKIFKMEFDKGDFPFRIIFEAVVE